MHVSSRRNCHSVLGTSKFPSPVRDFIGDLIKRSSEKREGLCPLVLLPLGKILFFKFCDYVLLSCHRIITCSLACSSSSRSHPGACKLLSMASFNFQAEQVVERKGSCECFSSSANYGSLRSVERRWRNRDWIPPLSSSWTRVLISCFGSWRSCTGRAGSSRQGHDAAGFSWQDGVYLSTSARVPGSCRASP